MGVLKVCIVCGKEFYVPQYRAENPKTKYCSRSCLAKNLLKAYAEYGFKKTGKPHHQYNRRQYKVNGKTVTVYEHREIMERILGRKLTRGEHVHHINGDSRDNRPANLQVLSNADHQRLEYDERHK